MADFTPGPWEAIRGVEASDDMRCGVAATRGDLAYMVATIENGAPGDFCETEWANAQIMAASPVMFEALDAIDNLLTEEIAARSLAEGSELYSLLVVPRNIARAATARLTDTDLAKHSAGQRAFNASTVHPDGRGE